MSSPSSAGQRPRTTRPTGTTRGLSFLAPAAALVLVALCLRGPFSAVGPVAGDLRAEFSLSTAALGVLTHGERLHLTLRYRHAEFDRAAAEQFLALFRGVLAWPADGA